MENWDAALFFVLKKPVKSCSPCSCEKTAPGLKSIKANVRQVNITCAAAIR